jgi:hypothetical protein
MTERCMLRRDAASTWSQSSGALKGNDVELAIGARLRPGR